MKIKLKVSRPVSSDKNNKCQSTYSICKWFCLCILISPLISYANAPVTPGLIGLLEIPALYEADASKYLFVTPIPIQPSPESGSKSLGTASSYETFEAHEWSYEQPAAAVFSYRHDGQSSWYQVRIKPSGQTGWLKHTGEMVFHPLSALITESLPYLTGEWNGRIYRIAGDQGTVTQIEIRGPETPVAVASSAMLDNKLWLLVVVLKESPCSSAEAPAVVRAGWIPAHSKSGDLNIWFYSRGC